MKLTYFAAHFIFTHFDAFCIFKSLLLYLAFRAEYYTVRLGEENAIVFGTEIDVIRPE